MQNRIIQIILFVVFLAIPIPTLAIPSVSEINGNVSHGQSIIVSGSGFGLHSNYNVDSYLWSSTPYLSAAFKDFEDNSLTSNGFSVTGSCPGCVSIQGGGPINSTHYERALYDGGAHVVEAYGPYQEGNNQQQIYSNFWWLVPSNSDSGKMWRWYFGPASGNDNIYLAVNTDGVNSEGISLKMGGDMLANAWNGTTVVAGDTSVYGNNFSAGTWHKIEIYASEPNGLWTVWVDGIQNVDYVTDSEHHNNLWSFPHTMTPDGHTVEYPDMTDGNYSGGWDYDDIYVDYTPARVEICNGSTWVNRGICNTQVSTNWNSSSIGLKVNKGTFSNGDSKYLYVIDSTGTANADGFPITFGESGSGDTTAPSAPTGLGVL